jgi:predicted ester cyclase
MHPLVGVLRRYAEEYTNGHDLGVVPAILDRSYRFVMSGTELDYDQYVSMVDGAFDQFPDLQLVVSDLFTNGERLAMRFTEHASSAGHEMRRAAWQGISLYRWNGVDRLTECLVEQDFYGRRQQLAVGEPDPVPGQLDSPWDVGPVPTDPGVLELAFDAVHTIEPEVLDDWTVEIVDGFSAGTKAAVKATWRGVYAGGLHSVPAEAAGAEAAIDGTAILHADAGRIVGSWVVLDRFGLAGRLRRA